MALAQHKPCQDQLDVTSELGFIDILHARVNLENCLCYHILISDPDGKLTLLDFSNHCFNKRDLCHIYWCIPIALGFDAKEKVGAKKILIEFVNFGVLSSDVFKLFSFIDCHVI